MMVSTPDYNRLHTQIAYMIALEDAIEQTIDKLLPKVSDHAEATSMLSHFHTVAKEQRQSLVTRLEALTGTASDLSTTHAVFSTEPSGDGNEYPVSTALQFMYTLLNQAVIGYSTLQAISHRFRDSRHIADEGTAAHLARDHTQVYVRAIGQISRLLHDVVLWELDRAGFECRCICPSCDLGICLCAVSSRNMLRDAWLNAGPFAEDNGIYIHLPKKGSAAARAGLRTGDVIVSIGNNKIETYGDLQHVVQNSEPGDSIQLTVQRSSGRLEEISVACV